MKILPAIGAVLLTAACSNTPIYNSPVQTVPQAEVAKFWVPASPIGSKNTKVVSAPDMGCRAVYLEGGDKRADDYIDIKYTIDSKGSQRDMELVSSGGNVDEESILWAMKFGLSPTSKFVPSDTNAQRTPIGSVKRLYLIAEDPLCEGKPDDITFYSNQTISIAK